MIKEESEETSPDLEEFYRGIATRLQHLRLRRSLSEHELGQAAGVESAYIRYLQLHPGNVSAKMLFGFATALGVQPRDLLPDIWLPEDASLRKRR